MSLSLAVFSGRGMAMIFSVVIGSVMVCMRSVFQEFVPGLKSCEDVLRCIIGYCANSRNPVL